MCLHNKGDQVPGSYASALESTSKMPMLQRHVLLRPGLQERIKDSIDRRLAWHYAPQDGTNPVSRLDRWIDAILSRLTGYNPTGTARYGPRAIEAMLKHEFELAGIKDIDPWGNDTR